MKFKIGDKVKIPITKRNNSDIIDFQKSISDYKLDYLIVSQPFAINNIGLQRDDEIYLTCNSFYESDLELYEEFQLSKRWCIQPKNERENSIIAKWFDENWGISDDQTYYQNEFKYSDNFPYYHYGLSPGNVIFYSDLNKQKLTFEQFEKHILKKETMEKKLLGYKLTGKVTLKEAANILSCDNKIYDDGCFIKPFHNILIDKVKRMGVLDIWFEPVYEDSIIKIGNYEVKFLENKIRINGYLYSNDDILKIQEVLNFSQIKSLNVGCSGQYKVDLETINKIINNFK